MRLRFDRSFRNSLLFLLMFLVAMQLPVSRTFLLIALCLLFMYIAHRSNGSVRSLDMVQIQRLCMIDVGLLGFFVLIQIYVLDMGIVETALDVATISCVHIGFLAGAIGMKAFASFEIWLKGVLMFVIGFSAYYLLLLLLYGMPIDRDSALGIVSSNFCAAVLLLNYPIILYNLFARKADKRRRMTGMCYAALALSMMVIASSGSRTALGCVALMAAQLMFFRLNRVRNIVRYTALAILSVIGVAVAYLYLPGFHDVLIRALDAFGGRDTLNSDVRQLIWTAALSQFNGGNRWIGSGTSYVTQYNRSVHNLFYEVLLCTGWLGLALFIIMSALLILLILRAQKFDQRFFTVMLLISTLVMAFVQPFFSTSYPCGIIVWASMYVLTYDAKGRA